MNREDELHKNRVLIHNQCSLLLLEKALSGNTEVIKELRSKLTEVDKEQRQLKRELNSVITIPGGESALKLKKDIID